MGSVDVEEREPLLGTKDVDSNYQHKTQQPERTKTTWTWRSTVVAGALATAVAAVAVLQLSPTTINSISQQIQIYSEEFMDLAFGDTPGSTFKCSGHGTVARGGKCLCDLGYAGAQCSQTYEAKEPLDNTVALFVNEFGALQQTSQGRAQATSELASSLKNNGFDVTVIYSGTPNPMLTSVATKWANQGITLQSLTSSGVNFGENVIEEQSYNVYQHLQSSNTYSHVYFPASSGLGYYTLLAQSQGLLCTKTKFIVAMDSLPRGNIERIESGDAEYMPLEVETLKLDYLQQQSVELADITVFSSEAVKAFAVQAGWNIAQSDIIPSLPAFVAADSGHSNSPITVKEIVFVGPMNIGGGLKLFCDAIDEIAESIGQAGTKVTFLGASSKVNEFTSEEYIELRSLNWDSTSINWSVRPTKDIQAVLNYLGSNSGRLAVVPSVQDSLGALVQSLIASKIPFIGSTAGAAMDLVGQDKANFLVAPHSTHIAEKVKIALGQFGARVATPAFTKDAIVAKWSNLLTTKTEKTCVTKFDKFEEKPLVSVVVVHHNRHKLLRQTIESLEGQTYKNFEVIIVDDGSTDPESVAYLEELSWQWWQRKGWKVLKEPNRYLGAARNTGAKQARGQYVLFLDDDDYSKPHHIETVLRVALNTDADVVTAGHDVFSGLSRPTAAQSNKRFVPLGASSVVGMLENSFGDSAMLVRKNFFVDFGGFTEEIGVGFEDYEFLAKVVLAERNLQTVPESLHWYRRHAVTMSTNTNLKENQLRFLRPYVDSERSLSKQHKALLENTRKSFFEQHGISFDEALVRRGYNTNSTKPGKITCKPFADTTGDSGIQISLTKLWEDKSLAFCWNAGTQSTGAASGSNLKTQVVLLPVYETGGLAGLPVVGALPCDKGTYSDAWTLLKVVVPGSAPFNYYKDFKSLSDLAGYATATLIGVYNRPLVPTGSSFTNSFTDVSVAPAKFGEVWYIGNKISYVDFGVISNTLNSNSVPLDQKVAIMRNGSQVGSPIGGVAPGAGSGFYTLGTYDVSASSYYVADEYTSLASLKVGDIKALSDVQNCPTVVVDLSYQPSALSLTGVEPGAVPKSGTATVKLVGKNFNQYVTIYVDGKELPKSQFNIQSSTIVSITLDLSVYPDAYGSINIGANTTAPVTMYYYPPPSSVFSVAASTLLTKTPNQPIAINGVDLVPIPGAICVFNVSSYGVSTPMSVTTSTVASCNLPNIASSGVYSVSFTYSAPVTSKNLLDAVFLPIENSAGSPPSIPLTVFTQGPMVKYAKFSDSGSGVLVEVDKPTSVAVPTAAPIVGRRDDGQGSGARPCSDLFDANPAALVSSKLYRPDNPSDCTYVQTSPTTFKLTLKGSFAAYDEAALIPNGTIAILPNVLAVANDSYSTLPSSRSFVNMPDNPVTPSVSADNPSFIPVCSDLVIDLSASFGSAGRLFSVSSSEISFTSSSNMDPNTAEYIGLQNVMDAALLAYISGQNDVVTIPASSFWLPLDPQASYETYTITVTLTNFLGASSSTTIVVNRVRDNSVPLVVVQGVNRNSVRVGRFQTIRADGSQACGNTSPIQYKWAVGPKGCPGVQLPTGSATQVIFPPFTLQPGGLCELELQYQYAGSGSWFSTIYDFKTAPGNLMVYGGSSRTVGADQSLIIDAIAFDDSTPAIDPSTVQCTWSCQVDGQSCPSSVTSQLSGCYGNNLTGIVVPGVYDFGVTMIKNSNGGIAIASSKYDTTVTVVPGQVPLVHVNLNEGVPSAFSSQFALVSTVDASSVSSLSGLQYTWSNCVGGSYAQVDFTDQRLFVVNISSTQLQTLKFTTGALLSGSHYCFNVNVLDPKSQTVGTASIQFATKEMPNGGSCEIVSQTVNTTQPLKYKCPLWSTDSSAFPLSYSFLVRQSSSDPWTQIGSNQLSSSFSTDFGSGNYQIRAIVRDSAGSEASGFTTSFSVVQPHSLVRRFDGCLTTVCRFIADATANYTATKNVARASKNIAVAAVQITQGSPDFTAALALLQQLVDDILVDATSNGPFLAALLETLAGNAYQIDTVNMEVMSNIVATVLKSLKFNGKREIPASCVDFAQSQSFFTVIDQLLGSLPKSGLNATAQASVMQYIDQSVSDLSTCYSRLLAPQEYPATYPYTYISQTIGIGSDQEQSNYCSFTTTSGVADGYYAYTCGSKSTSNYPLGTAITSVAPTGYDFAATFLGTEVNIPLGAGAVAVNITGYATSANSTCVVYSQTQGQWIDSGCTATIQSNTAICNCERLPSGAEVSFGARAALIGPVPSSTTTQTGGGGGGGEGGSGRSATLSGGAIAGIVVGCVVVAAVVAGAVVAHRRSQEKKSLSDMPLPVSGSGAPASYGAMESTSPATKKAPAELTEVVSTQEDFDAPVPALAPIVAAPVLAPSIPVVGNTTKPLPAYIKVPTYDEYLRSMSR